MPLSVRPTTAAETAGLRRDVLRGGRPVPLPGDDDVLTAPVFHVGAYDGGVLVGTGNVRRESPPGEPGRVGWRLRGMATAEGRRGQGVGTAVLEALVRHCREQGGGLLWCNARTPARSFYERAGFTVVGEPWDDPEIGPHVRMQRPL